jgi:hypothetical protein
MCPFLVIRQVRAYALGHHHDESTIIHIKPVGTADELIRAVPYEWTVYVLAQIRLVESSHDHLAIPFGATRAAVLRHGCELIVNLLRNNDFIASTEHGTESLFTKNNEPFFNSIGH